MNDKTKSDVNKYIFFQGHYIKKPYFYIGCFFALCISLLAIKWFYDYSTIKILKIRPDPSVLSAQNREKVINERFEIPNNLSFELTEIDRLRDQNRILADLVNANLERYSSLIRESYQTYIREIRETGFGHFLSPQRLSEDIYLINSIDILDLMYQNLNGFEEELILLITLQEEEFNKINADELTTNLALNRYSGDFALYMFNTFDEIIEKDRELQSSIEDFIRFLSVKDTWKLENNSFQFINEEDLIEFDKIQTKIEELSSQLLRMHNRLII